MTVKQAGEAGSEGVERVESVEAPSLLQSLGPGLLWAGTAVGVSHLVQSTRAGAGFGFALMWVVVLANLLKYPAFEAAPRYTAATGKSLLLGYRKQGTWALWLFLALTVGAMFTVVAAVTIVTAGMASAMISDVLSPPVWSLILLAVAAGLLASDRFALLEGLMKFMMLALTVSTVACVLLLLGTVDLSRIPWSPMVPELTPGNVAFVVALVGWMPTAIDMSVWQSLWALEKSRSEKRPVTMRGALFDFKVGYVGTVVLALCFVTLGAAVLHGTGAEIPNSGGAFATLFVDLYAQALGDWSRPLVLVAAFTTMLSTTITCSDGFPRALEGAFEQLRADREGGDEPVENPDGRRTRVYWISLAVISVGALVLITFFARNLKGLVDLATTLSFLTAPLLATLNLRAVRSPDVPSEHRPRGVLLVLHVAGIAFTAALALYYVYIRLTAG